MSREEFFYLLPYLLSLAIILGVLFFSLRHRHVQGVNTYLWFLSGQSLTVIGFLFELLSPNLQTKILWDKFQWLTDSFLVFIPFLVFSIQFSGYKLRRPRLTWSYWLFFPILLTLVLLTDNIHHLLYPNPHLGTELPFPELQYDYTIVVYAYALFYVYGANFYGIGLLLRRAVQSQYLYRYQYLTVALGFLIPLILSFFSLANIRITPQRDIAPFSFAIGNLIVAIGLFRYGLFAVVPIAREQIIENMSDAIIVLDSINRVVDINSAALNGLGRNYSNSIGQPAQEVFAKWPILVDLIENFTEAHQEISLEESDDIVFYDISISPIFNPQKELVSRVVAAHDITRQKTLEVSYRTLSKELEKRVVERTKELHEIAERYRAVVENQQEFIVRTSPDGMRTFVNDAYCRFFEITPKQALATSFFPHVFEEDRPNIEQKLFRLSSGKINVETDIHRVIKTDGNIYWQEWTDQAIRDETGNVVEIQSVGRDITQRKLAEDRLAEAYDTTLEGWSRALDLRDKETEGHTQRVTEAAIALARAMNYNEDEIIHFKRGGLLHDIGKMGIPDSILLKPGELNDEEWVVMRKHPVYAYELLSKIEYLKPAIEIPYCHHEKWDGSGYPRGLKGEEIPFSARIFSVVDVWDALSFDRPYRGAWEKQAVAEYISDQAAKQFDPQVVHVFIEMLKDGRIQLMK